MKASVRAKINSKRNKTVTTSNLGDFQFESKPEDSPFVVQDAVAHLVNNVIDQVYEIELSKIDQTPYIIKTSIAIAQTS